MRGVYGIFNDNSKCLYIGYSSRLVDRMQKHRYYFKKPEMCNVEAQRQMYEDMRSKYTNIKVHYIELNVLKNKEDFWKILLKPYYGGR